MASPTSRSLEYFRKQGWQACVVERHNSFINIKNDAFGFGDILVCDPGPPGWIMLAQVTSTPNVQARIEKIQREPMARVWLKSGGSIHVFGWKKYKPRNKRAFWKMREVEMVLEDERIIPLEVE